MYMTEIMYFIVHNTKWNNNMWGIVNLMQTWIGRSQAHLAQRESNSETFLLIYSHTHTYIPLHPALSTLVREHVCISAIKRLIWVRIDKNISKCASTSNSWCIFWESKIAIIYCLFIWEIARYFLGERHSRYISLGNIRTQMCSMCKML